MWQQRLSRRVLTSLSRHTSAVLVFVRRVLTSLSKHISAILAFALRVLTSLSKHTYTILIFALMSVIVVAALALPTPSTLVVVTAKSETASVVVAQREAGRIGLTAAYNDETGACLTGVEISPDQGTKLTYTRIQRGPLYLGVAGSFALTSNETGLVKHNGAFRLIVGDPARGCESAAGARLPANGIVEVGNEGVVPVDTESAFLLEGKLTLLNRAIDKLYGIIPLDWGPFSANGLYPEQEVGIPAGARLANAKQRNGELARWWGFVDFDPESTALDVRMSSNAISLELFGPTPAESSGSSSIPSDLIGAPDIVAFSQGARLANDPNLRWLYGLAAFLALFFGLLQNIRKRSEPKDEHDAD